VRTRDEVSTIRVSGWDHRSTRVPTETVDPETHPLTQVVLTSYSGISTA
jgi:hypothetical protein